MSGISTPQLTSLNQCHSQLDWALNQRSDTLNTTILEIEQFLKNLNFFENLRSRSDIQFLRDRIRYAKGEPETLDQRFNRRIKELKFAHAAGKDISKEFEDLYYHGDTSGHAKYVEALRLSRKQAHKLLKFGEETGILTREAERWEDTSPRVLFITRLILYHDIDLDAPSVLDTTIKTIAGGIFCCLTFSAGCLCDTVGEIRPANCLDCLCDMFGCRPCGTSEVHADSSTLTSIINAQIMQSRLQHQQYEAIRLIHNESRPRAY